MNVRSLIILSLLVFIVFLNACAHRHEIRHGLNPDQINENNSVVILSTRVNTTSIFHTSYLNIRRTEDGKSVYVLFLYNPFVKSHFDDHWGQLHILTFKPGKYFFKLTSGYQGRYENPSSFIVFEVKEREVVYIGEVVFEFFFRDSYAKLTINDEFERDVGIFLEKNPLFNVKDVRKRSPYRVRE